MADSAELLLTRGEADAIRANLPAALAAAEAALVPADNRAFAAAVGLIGAMPAASVSDAMGDAALAGYRIAVGDLPGDLLMFAARSALRDVERTFRPSPPELRAYAIERFDARKRRLRRLKAIGDAPRPAPAPMLEMRREPSSQVLKAEGDRLLAELQAKDDASRPRPAAGRVEPPGSGLRSLELQERAAQFAAASRAESSSGSDWLDAIEDRTFA